MPWHGSAESRRRFPRRRVALHRVDAPLGLVEPLSGLVDAPLGVDHVIVSALHVVFGIWLGGPVSYGDLAANVGLAILGNVVGGLFLITFTHAAQVWSERRERSPNGDH